MTFRTTTGVSVTTDVSPSHPIDLIVLYSHWPNLRLDLYMVLPGPLSLANRPPQPYCNGHSGPFDPTRSPQYYDSNSPHLAFITCIDSGKFPAEELKCMPATAVWVSERQPNRYGGFIQGSYREALRKRGAALHSRARELLTKQEYRDWKGFVEAYPWEPPKEEFDQLSEVGLKFEEVVTRLPEFVQLRLMTLVAWVRMGLALVNSPPQGSLMDNIRPIPLADDDCMGLWINGVDKPIAAWLGELGIPMFVAHSIQSKLDHASGNPFVASHPLQFCDINSVIFPHLFNDWIESGDRQDKRTWNVGVDSQKAQPEDQLVQWRSFSGATKANFLGEQWRELDLGPSSSQRTTLEDRLTESPMLPPPVQQALGSGQWENFMMSDKDFLPKFYLVGRKNKGAVEDTKWKYYNCELKRILHCERELLIPRTVTFNMTPSPPTIDQQMTETVMQDPLLPSGALTTIGQGFQSEEVITDEPMGAIEVPNGTKEGVIEAHKEGQEEMEGQEGGLPGPQIQAMLDAARLRQMEMENGIDLNGKGKTKESPYIWIEGMGRHIIGDFLPWFQQASTPQSWVTVLFKGPGKFIQVGI
ncbi:hypothetical protein BDP27DRAFT_1374771 [Rhodocollybia butyracea]|uniref:Uncharacterized protein n=1 Tax=Rhodocollybia butyracea TaxID=206335 RepID=A0A9P5TVU0_9AGAR|nr:hypothetical protein BDP27DRAFT_1374771 [Rhodocollybia butyracea]